MRITIGVLSIQGEFEPGEDSDVILNSATRALEHAGYESVVTRTSLPQPEEIRGAVLELAEQCDVLLTTGGCGFSPLDNAPEVTQGLVERPAAGLEELIRANLHKRTEASHLHRGVAGIRRNTVIVNLPGSAESVKESIETIALLLRPMISSLKGLRAVQDVH